MTPQQDEAIEQIKKTIQQCIINLVSNPTAVSIDITHTSQTRVFEIKIDPTDKGKVIGKNGEMIKCIRTIVRAIASKHQMRCYVELFEE